MPFSSVLVPSVLWQLALLVGWLEGHLACKTEWWGAGVVFCLGQGADLHMAQIGFYLFVTGSPR